MQVRPNDSTEQELDLKVVWKQNSCDFHCTHPRDKREGHTLALRSVIHVFTKLEAP